MKKTTKKRTKKFTITEIEESIEQEVRILESILGRDFCMMTEKESEIVFDDAPFEERISRLKALKPAWVN